MNTPSSDAIVIEPEPSGSPGPTDEETERFATAWEAFVLAVRRSQARGQSSPDAMSLAQYYLLAPLGGGDALPVSQLAAAAGISAPTATRLVDGLERDGVLRRARTTKDRRTVLVSLTPAGHATLGARRAELAARRRRLYEQLAPDERAASARLLGHLAELICSL